MKWPEGVPGIRRKRMAALLAAACLFAAAPILSYGMTLAELTKLSATFSDMTQKILQIVANADERTRQANAEMDLRDKEKSPSPEEVEQAFGRIAGHLQAARDELKKARVQMHKLGMLYQREVSKRRKGKRAPSPTETEEDRQIASRFNDAYREAEIRTERANERAKYALMEAEARFKTWKKSLLERVERPGN